MRFAFAAAERVSHTVAMLCRVIGASVGGFYAWLGRAAAREERAKRRAALLDDIRRVFEGSHRRYGSRRVHAGAKRRFAPGGGQPIRPPPG